MTRYSLRGGDEASLVGRPLMIRTEATALRTAVSVQVRTADGHDLGLVRRTTLAVLPRVAEELRLSLESVDGSLLPSGSVIDLTVGPDGADDDYVHVRVDLSGLAGLEVLSLTPSGDRVRVGAIMPVPDPPLTPLAERARDLTRRELGVAVAHGRDSLDLRVALDVSPSMRRWLADGTSEAILDVLAGIASVIDPDRQLDALLCARDAQRLPASGLDVFARSVVTSAGARPLQTGNRPPTPATDPRLVTYFVTDAGPGGTALPPRTHRVVVGDRLGTDPAGSTLVRGGAVVRGAARWSDDDLAEIVASLLDGIRRVQEENR